MACKNHTSIIPFVESSLSDGECNFSSANTSDAAVFYGYLESLDDTTLRFFMIGQGPGFLSFQQANQYCNGSLKMAVKWVTWDASYAPVIPEKSKASCFLDRNVIPVYLLYSKGQDVSPAKARQVAESLNGAGPVIISTEVNFDENDASRVVQQVNEIKSACPKCLVMVSPKDLALSNLGAPYGNDGRSALEAVMSQVGDKVDIIGQGTFANEYPYDPMNETRSGGLCSPYTVLYARIKNSRDYVLKNYSKPILWTYFGVAAGENTGNTCIWTEESAADLYNLIFSASPYLANAGIIGVAPYSMTPGGGPLTCPGAEYCSKSSLMITSYFQRTPQFGAWFDACQKYSGQGQTSPSRSVPILFPENGVGSCNYVNVLSMIAGQDQIIGRSYPYTRGQMVPAELPYSCEDCAALGSVPSEFMAGTAPDVTAYCFSNVSIMSDSCADSYGVDQILVRAISYYSTKMNATSVICVQKDDVSYDCNPNKRNFPESGCDPTSRRPCYVGPMACKYLPGYVYQQNNDPWPATVIELGKEEYAPTNATKEDGVCCGARDLAVAASGAEALVEQYKNQLGVSANTSRRAWMKMYIAALIYETNQNTVSTWLGENWTGKTFVQYATDVKGDTFGKGVMTAYGGFTQYCPSLCPGSGDYVPELCPFNQTWGSSHGNVINPIRQDKINTSHCTERVCDWRGDHWHSGLDIGIPEGTELVAVFDGNVSQTDAMDPAYGTLIKITDDEGRSAFYGHLRCNGIALINDSGTMRFLRIGDRVNQSQAIGYSGGADACQGNSTGPHLHFELWNDEQGISRVDPNGALIVPYSDCPIPDPKPPTQS